MFTGFRFLTLTFLLLALSSAVPWAHGQITRAIDVRTLPVEQAIAGQAVRIRGTVGFIEAPGTVFIQDETAGTFFRTKSPLGPLQPGDLVEVVGQTVTGLYLTGIEAQSFTVLSRGDPPAPVPASYDDLIDGRFHYQRVVIEGVGRRVTALDENRSLLFIALGERVLEVRIDAPPPSDTEGVDARLRIVGLAAGGINDRRQLVFPYLRVTDWKNVTTLQDAPDESTVPLLPAAGLLRFGTPREATHRVRVQGLVLGSFADGRLFIRDPSLPPPPAETPTPDTQPPLPTALSIRLSTPAEVVPGHLIEVIGFPDMQDFSAGLADASVLSVLSTEVSPAAGPASVTASELLSGTHDADLVTLPATLLETFRTSEGTEFRLQAESVSFTAFLPSSTSIALLPPGARVQATGICRVDSATDRGFRSRPDRASLLLRQASDLTLLSAPTWWTARRLLAALAGLGLLTLLSVIWIAGLRRQVAKQALSLRQRITHEAALEERQRIAREFHDTLEQELVGLTLHLDAAATRPAEEKMTNLVKASRQLVSRIQVEVRNIVSDLRDAPESVGDLRSALETLVSRQPPGAPAIRLEADKDLPALPPLTVHQLRMIAQEAVTNVLKHARATHIVLRLHREPDHLLLTITDDGVGFEPDAITHGNPGHFGCMGIRERSRKIGATVLWQRLPTGGTEVKINLPLPQQP